MKCPHCNFPHTYTGFTTIECTNPLCQYYKPHPNPLVAKWISVILHCDKYITLKLDEWGTLANIFESAYKPNDPEFIINVIDCLKTRWSDLRR